MSMSRNQLQAAYDFLYSELDNSDIEELRKFRLMSTLNSLYENWDVELSKVERASKRVRKTAKVGKRVKPLSYGGTH